MSVHFQCGECGHVIDLPADACFALDSIQCGECGESNWQEYDNFVEPDPDPPPSEADLNKDCDYWERVFRENL